MTDAAGLVSVINYPLPSALPLDYSNRGLLRVARINELVNACLRLRADGMITPRFVVERKDRDGNYITDDDHALLQLLRWPGQTIDTATLLRCLSVSWDATGLVYLEPIYNDAGILEAIEPLDPSLIEERRDRWTGELLGYTWGTGVGLNVDFAPDELIVRRTVFWADPPPLATALAAVDADASMTSYVRAFFSNAGVPSGILKVKGTWSRESVAEIQKQWKEKYGRDGLMQGGPVVLDDGGEYTRIGANLAELESDQLRGTAETRVCMPFGISPILIGAKVGLESSTYSNFGTALQEFWDGTMTPLLKEWASWFDRSLLSLYEPIDDIRAGLVRTRYDTAGIGPYVDDTAALLDQAGELFARGAITRNQYAIRAGFEPTPDGDVYYIPANVTVEQAAAKSTRANSRQINGANGENATMPRLVPPPEREPVQVKARETVTERHVRQYIEGEYAKANRLLRSTGDVEATIAALDEALDDGLDLAAILAPGVRKETERAYVAARRQKAVVRPQTLTDAIDRAVERMAARARDMARTTRDAISSTIRAGLDLLTAGKEAAPNRADTISTHERLEATNEGTLTGFDDGGVDTVRWVLGPNPCEICIPLAGQTYKLADVIAGRTPSQPQHIRCECQWDGVEGGSE